MARWHNMPGLQKGYAVRILANGTPRSVRWLAGSPAPEPDGELIQWVNSLSEGQAYVLAPRTLWNDGKYMRMDIRPVINMPIRESQPQGNNGGDAK